MNSKLTMVLLLILLLTDLSAAVEPIYVGSGVSGQVVNLDAGSAKPGSYPYFGRSGFVAPAVSQPKIVSTSILLYQAEKLRDEALAIRDDTERLHNLTLKLAGQAERNTEDVKALAGEVRSDAESSSRNAAQAENSAVHAEQYLSKVLVLHDDTFKLYNDTLDLSKNIGALADETKNNKDASARNLAKIEGYINEIWPLYHTLNLSNGVGRRAVETGMF